MSVAPCNSTAKTPVHAPVEPSCHEGECREKQREDQAEAVLGSLPKAGTADHQIVIVQAQRVLSGSGTPLSTSLLCVAPFRLPADGPGGVPNPDSDHENPVTTIKTARLSAEACAERIPPSTSIGAINGDDDKGGQLAKKRLMNAIVHPSVDERRAGERPRVSRCRRRCTPVGRRHPDRPDPVALLEEQNATREPDLVPVRHGRMLVSPFTFYRGAAKIMAADLKDTPTAGLNVQLCGDAHLSNFGVFASPDGRCCST